MIKIAFHPLYAYPLPEGHRFPMLKYELIPEQLLYEGTIDKENIFTPTITAEENILRVHDVQYWTQLRDATLSIKEQRRIGFPFDEQLVERELLIAQGTIDGAKYALEHKIAFNVAGGTHHAGSNWGEGFCLLNDQAIAASYLLHHQLAKRILIIDLDVHQGNGTAEIFYHNDNVYTFSMHGAKNFPFRKETSNLDIALEDYTSDDEYLGLLEYNLPKILEQSNADFVFYLSGVDVLATDKLGKLALSKEACKLRDYMVLDLCKKNNLPLQISMGGGYSEDIKIIVDAHCNTFRSAFEMFNN